MNPYIWLSLIIIAFGFGGLGYVFIGLILKLVRDRKNVIEFLVNEQGALVGVIVHAETRTNGLPRKCRVMVRMLSDEEVNKYMEVDVS